MADTRTFYAHEGYEVEAIEVYKLALIVRLRNAAKQLQAWPVSFPTRGSTKGKFCNVPKGFLCATAFGEDWRASWNAWT